MLETAALPPTPRYLARAGDDSDVLSPLQRELLRQYRDDGFVVVEDSAVLDDIDSATIWEGLEPNTVDLNSGRVMDGWRSNAGVRALATHPQVLDLLRLLYGRDPIPFQTLNFWNGTEQLTHSDTIHFSCFPERFMCGVWVALEDITLRQGPLHYYPGSHEMPEFDYDDLGVAAIAGYPGTTNPDVSRAYNDYVAQLHGRLFEAAYPYRELAIKRGSFLVWSSNLLHGGSRRLEKTLSRKSQVTHYYFEGVLPYTPMFSKPSAREYFVRRLEHFDTRARRDNTIDGRRLVFNRAEHGRVTVGFADALFDPEQAERYLERFPDVAESTFGTPAGAYEHYLQFGFEEGRLFFDRPRDGWLALR
jgi:hypothetical protein